MFSAARFSFCSRKQLARKGEKAPPESVLFRRAASREGIGIFRNRWGPGLSLKFRCDGKEQKAPRGQRGTTREKRPGRLPLFGKLFSRGTCPFPRPLRAVRAIVQSRFYQSESVQRGVPGGKDRPGNARIRGEADRFPRPIPCRGNELQPGGEGAARAFSEKKTLALLYKLERATRELAAVGQQVVSLSEEFKQRW